MLVEFLSLLIVPSLVQFLGMVITGGLIIVIGPGAVLILVKLLCKIHKEITEAGKEEE